MFINTTSWQKFVKCDTPSGSCTKVEVVIPRTSPNKLHFAQNGRQRCTSDKEDAIYYYFKKRFAYDETLAFLDKHHGIQTKN